MICRNHIDFIVTELARHDFFLTPEAASVLRVQPTAGNHLVRRRLFFKTERIRTVRMLDLLLGDAAGLSQIHQHRAEDRGFAVDCRIERELDCSAYSQALRVSLRCFRKRVPNELQAVQRLRLITQHQLIEPFLQIILFLIINGLGKIINNKLFADSLDREALLPAACRRPGVGVHPNGLIHAAFYQYCRFVFDAVVHALEIVLQPAFQNLEHVGIP